MNTGREKQHPCIALASYDAGELRVNENYLVRYGGLAVCKGYQYGKKLLEELENGAHYDLILLDDKLLDMDAADFSAALCRMHLPHKPALLLLFGDGWAAEQNSRLQQEESYCMIKPYRLSALAESVKVICSPKTKALRDFCSALYDEWGADASDTDRSYLTEAVSVAMRTDYTRAFRKEILGTVKEKYGVSISAVDNGIRRILHKLDEQESPAWRSFKEEHGYTEKKLTASTFVYAIRDAALQYKIRDK